MTSLWKLSNTFSYFDNGVSSHKVCNDFNSVSNWVKWKKLQEKYKKKFNEIVVCAKRDWETERKAFTFFGESNGHKKDFYPVSYTQFYQHTFAYLKIPLTYNNHTSISSIDIIIYWMSNDVRLLHIHVCIFVEFKRNARSFYNNNQFFIYSPRHLHFAKYLLCM